MSKYRFRLKNGRVIGPFQIEDIPELINKGHINGDEECQLYPVGDWAKISTFDDINKLFENVGDTNNSEATFVKKLSELNLGQDSGLDESTTDSLTSSNDEFNTEQINFPKEFSFNEDDGTKPLSATQLNNLHGEQSESTPEEEQLEDEGLVEEDNVEEVDPTLTETELNTRANIRNEENHDKTQINPDTLKYLEELKKEQDKKAEEEREKLEAQALKEPEVDLDNDSTQFISLDQLKGEVKEELDESISELKKEAKKEKIKKKKERIRKKKEKEKQIEIEEEEEEEESRLKKIIIGVIVIATAFILLSPEKEKPKGPPPINLLDPDISFPTEYVQDKNNPVDPEEKYKQGLIEYYKGGYKNKLKAIKLLKTSVQYKSKDNKAIPWLIYLYSDVLDNSNTKIEDAKVIFDLSVIHKTKAINNTYYAAAKAYFYLKMGKVNAAIKIIEEFASIDGNKPSVELFMVYLKALSAGGNLVKAEDIRKKLEGLSKKSYDIYTTLFDFYVFKSEYELAQNILLEAEKQFKEDVGLMLRKAKLLIYKEDFKSLDTLLTKIRWQGADGSKIYYSRYLEYKGLVAASNKKVKEAAKLFNDALKIHESDELRSRLAGLSESDDMEVNKVIIESKAKELIARAKNHLEKLNYKFATIDAFKAKSIAPNYIPAHLMVAQIQVKQSLFQEAIEGLQALNKKYTNDSSIAFELANAYIEAYKFDKAKRIITAQATPENQNNPTYYTVSAKYYVYKDMFQEAVNKLKLAININPLNDENVYRLAKVFMRYRKYNLARRFLKTCIELDPANVDYRVSYADIIYETDGTEEAIGYLLNTLVYFPDNARINGNIAIYYYKSGQQTQFKAIKEKLEKLPDKDPELYKFLIQAAKLDEKNDDVIKYSKELININPGDLQARLFLGQVYMKLERYKEALYEFNEIKSRLDTYPKLQYYMSKLYLLTDNVEEATKLAKQEIKANPSGIDGFILLGEILRNEKDYIEAEKYYKQAQKIDRDNVDVLIGLGVIAFKKSQYDSALNLLEKAKKTDPAKAEIHKLLGDVYRASQQSALAIESYKLFLELSPNSSYKENLESYIRMMQ
tara:strand:- start:192448 stop:195690 length:3243 start_codon:yes stop_codon:yes gene_type:complete